MAVAKPAGTWRYADLFALPNDGTRYEIVDGTLYELPRANGPHAITVANLLTKFIPFFRERGGWSLPPVSVFVLGADPVVPDITVLMPDRFASLVKRGIEGVPNLVVEVVSPEDPLHDTEFKRDSYARAGIPEYWVVDPHGRTVEVLALWGSRYRTDQFVDGDTWVTSPSFPALTFPASDAFIHVPV